MRTERRLARFASSLAALAALAGLVAGVPLALALAVGWPLPRGLPGLGELGSALSGQTIDDGILLKTIAVVCWLAWGQFVACLGAEIVGWKRGRGARHVPLAGGLQPLVAQLLMTAAVLVQLLSRPGSSATVRLSSTPAVHVIEVAGAPAQVAVPTAAAEPDPSVGMANAYTVKPRDDLWSLAETHLGNGHRWRELFKLNEGRPQERGGPLRRPNVIRPGWVLEFPADAVGLATPAPGEDPSHPEAPVSPDPISAVVPAASLEDMEPTPVACPGTPAAAEAAAPLGADTPPLATATHQASGPTPTEPPEPTVAAAPKPVAPGRQPGGSGSDVVAGLLGASLVAAGVVATLDRLRRAQQRRRPAGRRVRMPARELVPTEIAVRRAAAVSPAGRLDLALRAFAQCAADRPTSNAPSVSTVQVGDDGIEILLTEPLHAPAGPFVLSADGQVWTLPSSVSDAALEQASGDVGAPLPTLVSVGALGSTTVLVDLEASGTTVLTGDEDAVHNAFRTLVLELATSVWADTLDVVVVATDADSFRHLDRVRVVASLSEILPDVEAEAGALSDALVKASAATTLAARLGPTAADGWIPTVVLCADPAADTEAMAHLVEIAGAGGRGLAVVTAGEVAGASRMLRFEDGAVDVNPPGVKLSVAGPTTNQMGNLEQILVVATDCDGAEPTDPETMADDALEGDDAEILSAPFGDHDFDVLVRLLGAVEIEGAKEPVDRRKAVELVVYLATHPRGLDDERLKTALWPDDRAPQASFNTTVTRARSRLGSSADGSHHLPHLLATGGVYCVGPRVTTDFALLERHLGAARKATPEAAVRALRSALELVRGLPFAGGRQGYEWAYAEGFVARMETVVAEAAHYLAQLALEARDPELAQWAACQGLRASPGDEVLYRDRMLACDQAGNPAGVEAVMDELVAAVEAVEPYDTLHPETLALYQRLSHRRRRTG